MYANEDTNRMLGEIDNSIKREDICLRFVNVTMPFFEMHATDVAKAAEKGDVVAGTILDAWKACLNIPWSDARKERYRDVPAGPDESQMTDGDYVTLNQFSDSLRTYVRQAKYGQSFIFAQLPLKKRKKILKSKMQAR